MVSERRTSCPTVVKSGISALTGQVASAPNRCLTPGPPTTRTVLDFTQGLLPLFGCVACRRCRAVEILLGQKRADFIDRKHSLLRALEIRALGIRPGLDRAF